MMEQDILVGLVALGMGGFIAISAIRNSDGFSRFWLFRRIESAWGPTASRGVGAAIGVLVAFLGVLLILGLMPNRKSRLSPSTRLTGISLLAIETRHGRG